MRRLLFWTPRVICILFALLALIQPLAFLFAPGASAKDYDIWMTILIFLRDLIPTAGVVILYLIASRWAWVSGIVWGILGILYMWWGVTARHFVLETAFVVGGPMFLACALFLLDWYYNQRVKTPVSVTPMPQ